MKGVYNVIIYGAVLNFHSSLHFRNLYFEILIIIYYKGIQIGRGRLAQRETVCFVKIFVFRP